MTRPKPKKAEKTKTAYKAAEKSKKVDTDVRLLGRFLHDSFDLWAGVSVTRSHTLLCTTRVCSDV